MILAWHLVWTGYGWWFPNDIRGSWSKEVWKPALRECGDADERGRKRIQPSSRELRRWLNAAQACLKHKPIVLEGKAREIARDVIMEYAQLHNYVICAMSVLPDHMHVVVERHEHSYERIVNAFKSVSARVLRRYFGLAASPATPNKNGAAGGTAKQKREPIWSRGYWVRYLDTEKAVTAAVQYVRKQQVNDPQNY